MHRDVLVPQQAHHDRTENWKQQQDQLGPRGQAGDDRHRRNRVQRGQERSRSGRITERLLNEVPILRNFKTPRIVCV